MQFVFNSSNERDFKNLLEVYLEMIFNARLNILDF